jgi:phosphodiesterase/alkaline phosphatase D-like protein
MNAAPAPRVRTLARAALAPAILAGLLAGVGAFPLAAQDAPLFSHGVACGDASTTEAVLWTRTSSEVVLTPELVDPATGAPLRPLAPVRAGPETDYTVKVLAGGLPPGQPVAFRFRGPAGEASPIGACRTAPDPEARVPVTFAFSGDADWKWKPYPLLNALNRENLDFFFFLGDTIYETTNFEGTAVVEDLDGYRGKYRQNREPVALPVSGDPTPLRTAYQRFGMYFVFDNHELGTSLADPGAPRYTEGGAPVPGDSKTPVNQTAGFQARVQAFSEYQPVRTRTVAGTGDPRLDGTRGYFFTQPWGKDATLIVVDDRSYRDIRLRDSEAPEANDPGRTILGKPQLAWLEDQLTAAERSGVTWKFVAISSPIQRIGTASEVGTDFDGSKSWWGGYRVECDQLLKFIADNAIDNVVFLSTDNHNTMINNLRYRATPGDPSAPMLPARNAFEIITGPIGAAAGPPAVKAVTAGLSGRALERQYIGTLVGDLPNAEGVRLGQKQAGVDPIGLEPDFPGLRADSVFAEGGAPGVVEPAAFASFNTYTYALLQVNGGILTIQVNGMPIVDFARLADPFGLDAFTRQAPHPILRFQVQATGWSRLAN